eukprot:jgi/Hompol1/6435/HPOL_003581-RA
MAYSIAVFRRAFGQRSAAFSVSRMVHAEVAAAATATPEVSPKVSKLVDEIATLNLLETASLVSALKIRLNIQDVVMAAAPSAGVQTAGSSAGAPAAAAAAAPAEAEKPAEQTSFKLTLESFDAASKAKVIKEIKGMLPGANLVEAKKFVEGAPKMIKDSVPKEEALKIKALLESVGAKIKME